MAEPINLTDFIGYFAVFHDGGPGSSLYQGVVSVCRAVSAKQALFFARRSGERRRNLYAHPVPACPEPLRQKVIKFITDYQLAPTSPVPVRRWVAYAGTHASYSAPDD